MERRSLVILSYLYPPATAMGAVRVAKFASQLANDHGWSVHVVTPRVRTGNGSCRLETQLSAERVDVHETGALDPLRPLTWIKDLWQWIDRRSPSRWEGSVATAEETDKPRRRNLLARCSDVLAVPDTRNGWIGPAVYHTLRLVRKCDQKPVLLSSGPPHSAHVAAALVKRLTGCRWIADLRDPWSINPYNIELAPFARKLNGALERWTLRQADSILCNTEPACLAMRARLPELPPGRIVTVPNGFDPEDFENLAPRAAWPPTHRPVLLHAGSVYGKRDPSALLEALARLRTEQPDGCPQLVFLGSWTDDVRRRAHQIIARHELHSHVTVLDPLPRAQSFAAQAAADGLVLLGDPMPAMLQIPAKLFEYLWLQKPVLSLFPAGAPVEPYLERYAPQFATAAPDDSGAILNALQALCKSLGRPSAARSPVEELSRSRQVEQVQQLLEELGREEFPVVLPAGSEASGAPPGTRHAASSGRAGIRSLVRGSVEKALAAWSARSHARRAAAERRP